MSKINSLISVIIPVYNVEKYIHKCINSVINQTYINLEIILADDGSTDNCKAICDEYAKNDKRIKVIHKLNGGQGSARNMALDICKGAYISFIDSDDWIKKDMLEKMITAILENKCDIAICGIGADNGIKLNDKSKTQFTLYDNYNLIKAYISTPYIHTGPCNKLYKKELFNTIRFPEIRAHEDAFIMHEVLGKCKNGGVHVGECLYFQYIRTNSTEQSKFSIYKMSLLDCTLRLQNFIKINYPDLYKFVSLKKIDETIVLMKEILNSFNYNKYKDIYYSLYTDLKNEYQQVNINEINKTYMMNIENIINHNFQFRIKIRLSGFKTKLKNMIKKHLLR